MNGADNRTIQYMITYFDRQDQADSVVDNVTFYKTPAPEVDAGPSDVGRGYGGYCSTALHFERFDVLCLWQQIWIVNLGRVPALRLDHVVELL